MGLFKDFATSGYGDVTVGALQGLSEVGQRDAAKNERFAADALNKENESMKVTELAYKNKQQINNIIAENIFEFGFTEGSLIDSRLNKFQAADRLTNKIFNEQRSIFESNNFDTVKGDVARYLSRPGNIGEGIMLDSPYIPSQNKFQVEKDKHAAKLSEISKTPRVDKLLMNIREAEKNVPEPEAITDASLKVRGLSAKAYGILNTFPGTFEGDTNLKLNQTMIITANARELYPNDKNARVNFINKKMYQNNIDPLESIKFTNNFTFGEISNFVSEKNAGLISQLSENNNAMAQAQNNNERISINDLNNQILFKIYQNIDDATKVATTKLAGKDRAEVFTPSQTREDPAPETRIVSEDYTPSIDGLGNVVINLANGETSKIPIDVLINNSDNLKLLPAITQDYVLNIQSKLFKNGIMIKPTRNMFNDGPAGDKAFRDFLNLFNLLETKREGSIEELGGVGFIETPPRKVPKKDADIDQFKTNPENTQSTTEKKTLKKGSDDSEDIIGNDLAIAASFKRRQNNKNVENAYNYLNTKLSPEASAALLGNISVESPAFNFKQEEKTNRKNKGYGLFQFTDNKIGEGHRSSYFKYLEETNKEDSIKSQIDYVLDNINQGIGYDIGAGNRKKLQKIFNTGTVEEITKAFHDIFERPQPGSLEKRTKFAIDALNFYTKQI